MIDLLVACSPGGHFSEARELIDGIEGIDYKYVIHDPPKLTSELNQKTIIAPHAERDWRALKLFGFALKCVLTERPKIIMSTGSQIAVHFGIAGKLVGAKFVYVECQTRVHSQSLSLRLCRHIADRIYVRHKEILNKTPGAIWISEEK